MVRSLHLMNLHLMNLPRYLLPESKVSSLLGGYHGQLHKKMKIFSIFGQMLQVKRLHGSQKKALIFRPCSSPRIIANPTWVSGYGNLSRSIHCLRTITETEIIAT